MLTRAFKIVSISITLLCIYACSHPIEIVGEGDVTSASGTRNCYLEDFQAGQDNCSKNYVVGAYHETYYATPRTGWQFDHWGNKYCPDAAPPNYDCSFDVDAAVVREYWGQTAAPLQAVFTRITETKDFYFTGHYQSQSRACTPWPLSGGSHPFDLPQRGTDSGHGKSRRYRKPLPQPARLLLCSWSEPIDLFQR